MVDEMGEEHTSLLAASSRMLAGNTGCFSKERDNVIICLDNKKSSPTCCWFAVRVSQLEAVFDLAPAAENIDTAMQFKDEAERK
eukprot:4343261-Pleurochrysis_carterae.AAC.1